MGIQQKLTEDMKSAMRSKDKVALNVIRAVKSALKNASIEKGNIDAELEDSEVIGVIRKQVKQRQDSFKQFDEAGRAELAEKEKIEIEVLEAYLPAPLNAEEISKFVAEAVDSTGASGRADTGKVMKYLQETTKGRADGKILSQAVMQALS